MENTKPSFSLTGITIKDAKDNGFTAYFAELPDVIAEGESKVEAKKNLFDALVFMLSTRKQIADENNSTGEVFESESYEFELS